MTQVMGERPQVVVVFTVRGRSSLRPDDEQLSLESLQNVLTGVVVGVSKSSQFLVSVSIRGETSREDERPGSLDEVVAILKNAFAADESRLTSPESLQSWEQNFNYTRPPNFS